MKRIPLHPPAPEKPTMWRSLAELEGAPEFRALMEREFPGGPPPEQESGIPKRDFLKIMGASLALAGLAGCRRPESYLVPFNKGVEWSIPGKFLYYATAMPTREGAMPLIATTIDGRPTKLEGNPLHPFSNGGTDGFAQASVLDLYDPHRAKQLRRAGREVEPREFDDFLKGLSAAPVEGMAVLVEKKNSPTRDRLAAELHEKFPNLLWCEYEPLGEDPAAVAAAFGPHVRLLPRFERADVILALDSDFLGTSDQGVGYAAGFYPRRNPDQRAAPMNRLYVVENHYSSTGGLADHRYRCPASQIGEFARQLAQRIAVRTRSSALAAILGACPVSEAKFDAAWLDECAADLLSQLGRSIVIIGGQQPLWAQVLVAALNEALSNHGSTILGLATQRFSGGVSLPDLVAAMNAGRVHTLFILGGNPSYNAPADLRFDEALRRVATVVRLGLFEDETSRHVTWQVPQSHYLEEWGDVRAFDGTYTAIQPMILPLWGGISELQVLALLAGRPRSESPDLIKETFATLASNPAAWTDFLRQGFLPDSRWPSASLQFDAASAAAAIQQSNPSAASGMELVFLASSSVDDGRYANNSWLQETPDFETKVTWDNVALVSPATARRLGIRANNFSPVQGISQMMGHEIDYDLVADVIEIAADGVSIRAAALVAPGHADDSISLALGYGRKDVSALMDGVGFDAYPLRLSDSPRFRTGITVRVTDQKYPLARTQESRSMEGRDLFREGTLARYQDDPTFARTMGMDGHIPPNISLYQHPPLTAPEQWGMAVDLNICSGCNACLVACQAENNVPVVGKEQVRKNRDMAWIRIDRYFAGDPDDPEMLAQAIMCQHCENAPCETVCPVNATVHSEDGLNLMTYNRCIGTRYCANNCPWKVRRFNYFDYNQRPLEQLYSGPLAPKGVADSLKMSKNPNVTVRMRGVMEKCTFCIQRIEEAKISRLVKAGTTNKYATPLPEFKTACQQACPSGALVFGNIADQHSQVRRLRQSDRGFVMLKYLNAAPRVTYLARIRNPNMKMPGADRVGMANGMPHHEAKKEEGGHHG